MLVSVHAHDVALDVTYLSRQASVSSSCAQANGRIEDACKDLNLLLRTNLGDPSAKASA